MRPLSKSLIYADKILNHKLLPYSLLFKFQERIKINAGRIKLWLRKQSGLHGPKNQHGVARRLTIIINNVLWGALSAVPLLHGEIEHVSPLGKKAFTSRLVSLHISIAKFGF